MVEFNRYRLYFYSAPQYGWDARVDVFKDAVNVGTMLFMKPGQVIPKNTDINGRRTIHFPLAQFATVLDILRNEKPLYLGVVATNGIATIATNDEPVGEGEHT